MFLEHYGLREQPFGVTPDPRYLYFSAMHREALASLFYGIETGCGFLALIAQPGMGKTTLLLHLLERLRKTARTVFLFQTQCDSREFFRYLLTDLGVDASNQNIAHMHESLNSVLLSNAQMGRRFVLVIDEAQNLKKPVLETVRLLSDFETPTSKLMQIVLCGQPQLADRLSHPDLMQLRQRISIVSRLQPFTQAEVVHYIHHRLKVAGYAGPGLFDCDALDQIMAYSDGIPRNINNICFNALTLGYAKRQEQIDGGTVCEVLADLDLGILGSQSVAPITTQDLLSSAEDENPVNAPARDLPAPRSAWMQGVDDVATERDIKGNSVAAISDGDSNSTNMVAQGGSSDLLGAASPPQLKAGSVNEILANPDSLQTLPNDRRVPRMPDRAKPQAEKPRNGRAEFRKSAGVMWPNSAGKRREWLCESSIPVPESPAAGSDPLILPIADGKGQRTYSGNLVEDEFCGLRITNFRQTIRNQVLFGDSTEPEEQPQAAALDPRAHTLHGPKTDAAECSIIPTPSVTTVTPVFQDRTNSTAPSSVPSKDRKVSGSDFDSDADKLSGSEPEQQSKLIASYRRAVYGWGKRTPIPPRARQ